MAKMRGRAVTDAHTTALAGDITSHELSLVPLYPGVRIHILEYQKSSTAIADPEGAPTLLIVKLRDVNRSLSWMNLLRDRMYTYVHIYIGLDVLKVCIRCSR